MGQQEVLSILEKYKKPMSLGEITRASESNVTIISHALARLVKANDIKIMEIDRKQAMKFYKCKHRLRLYYC
jgi:hypothetical protein